MKCRLLVVCFIMFSGILFADMKVPASSLPKDAQDFISKNFKSKIAYVEQDFDSFEVKLGNGTKIDFYKNGDWKEVESLTGLDTAILPPDVSKAINTAHPNVAVIKAQKEMAGFKVKLQNKVELLLDSSGKIIAQEIDD